MGMETNVKSAEESLAKYRLLHFVIGAILAAVFLAIPKMIGVFLFVVMAAMLLPSVILPEFTANKWFDRGAVLVGAIAVGFVFFLLHKL